MQDVLISRISCQVLEAKRAMPMASYNFDVSVKNYDDGPERNADVLTVGFRKRRYSTAGTLESIEVRNVVPFIAGTSA